MRRNHSRLKTRSEKRALKLDEEGAVAATRKNVLMIAIDDMRPELGPCE